ncbi:DNA alkylation repair protein [Methanotrichaceae archaeon M04Ac]|uniref:DNA alkylation repair protein n=1 Tax=Candidatus Methanocrinis alkalitolerans TaxID=3033395 RepID=A0ABT5XEG5_9EURY|nr:DNA alkylation repair protein [Candidatus Methanocrinis alkalitolerans]MDF0593031.1 DNA alkylation repair protein [Candidatus Methanocrinis alkalitolerans]
MKGSGEGLKDDVVASVKRQLLEEADERTRESGQRFFKEEVLLYGVKASVVRQIAKKSLREMDGREKEEIFALCEELLKSDYGEEAAIAFEWAYSRRKEYEPSDFAVFEGWLSRYVNSWAKCDTLCNHTLGTFIEMYPGYLDNLKVWTGSENRWLRRAAAVTLILPARKGLFLEEVFEISDLLLLDADDLVQKGYGWMLKEASKSHQQEVFDYVMKNKVRMPRTALRYAIEKMPEDLRRRAMAR